MLQTPHSVSWTGIATSLRNAFYPQCCPNVRGYCLQFEPLKTKVHALSATFASKLSSGVVVALLPMAPLQDTLLLLL